MKEKDHDACRCGHQMNSNDHHPCHWAYYTCRKPAKELFIPQDNPPASLAGVQMKLSGYITYSCPEHEKEYKKLIQKNKE
jgi:hypothetical protein